MTDLVLDSVSKSYNNVPAVDNLSLELSTGKFLSLVGPSGCGKTTTLRMIVGFITPDGGTIQLDGRVLSEPGRVVRPDKRGMSMIFQSYALWPHKTVFQNVAYGLKLRKTMRANLRTKVMNMLDVVQMAHLADRYPSELSGGQQQRVALARALAIEPKMVVMDEPLSNLDANLREEMRLEIRRLHSEFGITTVYVTHDLAEALVVSDKIAVMDKGRVVQLGTPEEIYSSPATGFVAKFVGQSNFLPGTVTDQRQVLIGRQLVKLTYVRTGGAGEDKPGDSVTVALHPYDIAIRHTSDSPSQAPADDCVEFAGVVTRSAYLGDSREISVRLAELEVTVRARVSADRSFFPGEDVQVTVPVKRCRVLDG